MAEIEAKFARLVDAVATPERRRALKAAAAGIREARSVAPLAALLGEPALAAPGVEAAE